MVIASYIRLVKVLWLLPDWFSRRRHFGHGVGLFPDPRSPAPDDRGLAMALIRFPRGSIAHCCGLRISALLGLCLVEAVNLANDSKRLSKLCLREPFANLDLMGLSHLRHGSNLLRS